VTLFVMQTMLPPWFSTTYTYGPYLVQEREYELENVHRHLMDKDNQIAAAHRAEDIAIVSMPPRFCMLLVWSGRKIPGPMGSETAPHGRLRLLCCCSSMPETRRSRC
jgi:hypothetical protein